MPELSLDHDASALYTIRDHPDNDVRTSILGGWL